MKKLKYKLEYFALRLVEVTTRWWPYTFARLFASGLARFLFHVVRYRRTETLRRIKFVFGEKLTDGKVRRIAYRSLRNICMLGIESICTCVYTNKWIKRHVIFADTSATIIKELLSVPEDTPKHGLLLALPHMSNWYLAGNLMARYGINMYAIAGIQHNPYTSAWMNSHITRDITIYERGTSAIRNIVRSLNQGGVVAILPDVRSKTRDLSIPFLGGVANIGRGFATFARKTNSPIAVAGLTRNSKDDHIITISSVVYPNLSLEKEDDILRMTKEVMANIDSQIRANPGDWFWYNRRWVLDPITEAPQTSEDNNDKN